MTTLEIIAPTNQSFTASLYQRGSDTLIESLNLTENTNSKGVYRGTVTSVLSGYYKVIVYDNVTPIVVTDVLFDGSSTVFASDITLSTSNLTANTIWEHPDRTITDKTDFTLTSDYDAAKTASQFDANTDIIARVTLVDTTTTLTNSPIVDNQEIANTVWSTTTRTITGGTVDTLTNSPNVPSANDIASQVRTELTTELTRIDENVSAPKTLTANTLSEIITSMPDGLTAQQVWEYVERTITDKANFTLTTAYDAAKTASQFNANTDVVSRVTLVDTTTAVTEDITVTVDLTPISNTLTSLEESVDAVYDRIVYSVPEGPAYPIPAPSSANVTRVYSYCYDVHGRPVADVPITIKMMDVSTSANKGSYLSDAFTFTSDQYGVATAEIPRGTSFRFRVKSGTNGAWIEFRGVDAETYQLPFLINK